MTKAELISALAELPDNGEVLVEPLPGKTLRFGQLVKYGASHDGGLR